MKERIKNTLKSLIDFIWLSRVYFVYLVISILFIILLTKGIQMLIKVMDMISKISVFYIVLGFLIPFLLIAVIPISIFLFKKWGKTRKKEDEDIKTEKKKIRMPDIRGLSKFIVFLIFLIIVLVGWYRSEKIYEHYQQQRYQKSTQR